MKRTALLTLLVAATLAALPACTYTPGSATDDPLPMSQYPQITVSGDDLLHETKLAEPPAVSVGDYRPMSVTVALRLEDHTDEKVQYRFLFFDERRVPLDIDPGWKYTVLRGREKTYLQGSALDTTAVNWQLEVRPTK